MYVKQSVCEHRHLTPPDNPAVTEGVQHVHCTIRHAGNCIAAMSLYCLCCLVLVNQAVQMGVMHTDTRMHADTGPASKVHHHDSCTISHIRVMNTPAGSAWPADIPGWLYFPGADSPGFDDATAGTAIGTETIMQSCNSIQEYITTVSSMSPRCHAITTTGRMKAGLRPQSAWRQCAAWEHGMYVPRHVVDMMGLEPPRSGECYSHLCQGLHPHLLEHSDVLTGTCRLGDNRLSGKLLAFNS